MPNRFKEIEDKSLKIAKELGITINNFQSNSEGALIDRIHAARENEDGIIINPGAYAHYSYAIRDAIDSVNLPTIEVHLSDIHKREAFRHHSVIKDVCLKQIVGLGEQGYYNAIKEIYEHLKAKGIAGKTPSALIIGAGAVGIGIGASLLEQGFTVDFVENSQAADCINQKGIKRIGIFKHLEFSQGAVKAYTDFHEISEQFDYILVCTKAMANTTISKTLFANKQLLSKHGKIIICQNGWGGHEKYLAYFPADKVYSARIITGFSKPEPNISEVTVHAAPIMLGSLNNAEINALQPLAEAIANGGIPCLVSNDIEKALWSKMLYNCALNPLGAILKLPYGRLMEIPYCVQIMNNIIDEIYTVMKASGYQSFWPSANKYKKVFYDSLIPDTADHYSSTLQDIEKKRHSEIDGLTGSVIEIADRFNIAVPCNKMLYNTIKAIEEDF